MKFREVWHAAVHGVAKSRQQLQSRTQLSNNNEVWECTQITALTLRTTSPEMKGNHPWVVARNK